jgi:hypothetical protein
MSISGYRIASQEFQIPPAGPNDDYYGVELSGNPGEIILGGGWTQVSHWQHRYPELQIVANNPAPYGNPPTKYLWQFRAKNAGTVTVTVKVYAILASE